MESSAEPSTPAEEPQKVELPVEVADAVMVQQTLVAADRNQTTASEYAKTLGNMLSKQGLEYLCDMTVDSAKKYIESMGFQPELTRRLVAPDGLVPQVISILKSGL